MFTKQGNFTKKVTDLPNQVSPLYEPVEIKTTLLQPSEDLKATLNKLIDDLGKGSSASDLGAKLSSGTDSTVQSAIEERALGSTVTVIENQVADLEETKATNTRVASVESRTTSLENKVISAENRLSSTESVANYALSKANSNQSQIDTLVVSGDSSVEAAQARVREVGSDIKTFTTLQQRLNDTDFQLAQKAKSINGDYYAGNLQNFFNGLDPNVLYEIKFNEIHELSTSLIIDGKRINLRGSGGFKTVATNSLTMQIKNCPNVVVDGLLIDGNNMVNRGLQITSSPNAIIRGCEVKNVGNISINNVHGIFVDYGCRNIKVNDNHIHDITSSGVTRGIFITDVNNTLDPSLYFIFRGNQVENIHPASDGDAIVTERANYAPYFGIIESNKCINALKRGIKVQSGQVKVLNNFVLRDGTGEYSGISIYGNDCICTGNQIISTTDKFTPGIDTKGSRLIISKNVINNAVVGINDGIYYQSDTSNAMSDITITENQVINTRYSVRQHLTPAQNVIISNNTFIGTTSANIQIDGNLTKAQINNNICKDSSRNYYFINTAAIAVAEAFIMGNITQTNYGILSSAESRRLASNFILDNILNGAKTTGYKYGLAIQYRSTVPASGDNVVGDYVINTSKSELGNAGSKYILDGWLCVTSGNPGTWVQQRLLTGN